MAKKVEATQDVTGWEIIAPLPTPVPPPKSPSVTNVVPSRPYRGEVDALYGDDDPLAPGLKCEYCSNPEPGCGCWTWRKNYGDMDYSC